MRITTARNHAISLREQWAKERGAVLPVLDTAPTVQPQRFAFLDMDQYGGQPLREAARTSN
jgi:hypothetical protein